MRSAPLATLALLAVSLLVVGCSRPGAGAIGTATIAPTTAPPKASPTLSQSIPPSSQPPSSDSPLPEPAQPEPPSASISVDGGDSVVGELGSYSWENSGSGVPWLPGSPIHVGAGERLTVVLSRRVGVANWSVSRQTPGASLSGDGATGMAEGSAEPIAFQTPPSGRWSVHVSVGFADNRGSAAYYWLIEVD